MNVPAGQVRVSLIRNSLDYMGRETGPSQSRYRSVRSTHRALGHL